MISYFLTLANASVCLLTVLRLLTYQRHGAKYKPMASFFAYVLTICIAMVPIRVIFGHYQFADLSELLINTTLCVMFYRANGNVMQIINIGMNNGF